MKKRWVYILITTVIIILLCIFYKYHVPRISVAECLQNPETYEGCMITEYWEPKIGSIYSDGFLLQQRHAPSIRVYCDTSGLISGEFVGLRAFFHKEGHLQAVRAGVARNRKYKIWLSAIPVLFIGFFFFRYFRINIKNFQIELKENA